MQRAIPSFGRLKTLIFACKTNSSTLKNTTQNAQKPTILRAKIKKFSGEGAQPLPRPLPRWRGGHPSPHLCPLGAYGASILAPAALKLGAYGASFSSPPHFFLPSAAYAVEPSFEFCYLRISHV